MDDWEELTPVGNVFDEGSSQSTDGASAPDEWVVSGNVFENPTAEPIPSAPDVREGFGSAVGSSADTISSAYNEFMGNEAEATALLAEAQKYKPGITWDEVKAQPDFMSMVGAGLKFVSTEALPQAIPYLAPAAVGVVAAPFTGGASITAPVAMASAVLSGGQVTGNIMTEQRESGNTNTAQAITAGALVGGIDILTMKNPVLKNIIMDSPLIKNLIVKPIARVGVEGAEEVVTTGASLFAEQMVGRDMSFSDTMKNFDQALVSSAGVRAQLSAPSTVLARNSLVSERMETGSDVEGISRQADESTLLISLDENESGVMNDARFTETIDQLWTDRDMENSAEAAKALRNEGGVLTPKALDVEVNTGLVREDGTPITENLGKRYGVDATFDKFGRSLSEKFDIPLVGKLVDPASDYKKTSKAFDKMTDKFNDFMGGLQLSGTAKENKAVINDVNNYVQGYTTTLNPTSKKALARMGDLEVFDKITIQKRARQYVENMAPSDASGRINALASAGVEAVAMGGVPVISATVGTAPAILAAGLNAQQKAKMDFLLRSDPETIKQYNDSIKAMQALLNRVEGPQGLEDEIVEKIKPDMGTLELVK